MDVEHPELDIQILAVNLWGLEQGNALAVTGRDLPLLQDEDANQDSASDAWTSWGVEWRDVVVLNEQGEDLGVFSLTTYDLAEQENYSAAKEILIGAAQHRAFWQNPTNQLDVGNDGLVTAVDDVLRLINEINLPTLTDLEGWLPLPMPPHRPAPYYDVSGDGLLSAAADILPVINFINQLPGAGEGESAVGLAGTGEELSPGGGAIWTGPGGGLPVADLSTSSSSPASSSPASPSRSLAAFQPDHVFQAAGPWSADRAEVISDRLDWALADLWDRAPSALLDSGGSDSDGSLPGGFQPGGF